MSGILDFPETRQRVMRVSVADYHHWTELGILPRRTELIRGVILDKMSKSPLHQSIAEYLRDTFLRQAPDGFCVKTDGPLALRDSAPEPDLAIVRGKRADFATRHPTTAELIVEIAVTSLREDRELCALYAEAGVPEYWIVLARNRKVEVYRQPEGGAYREMRVHGEAEELLCQSVPELRVKLAELFA